MEYFDIVDENGIPTGETIERSIAHSNGSLHRSAHIWIYRIVDGHVEVLLQKRSREKDSFPGCYDTSSAGHITAGDEPITAALRELSEELGIQAAPEDLTFIGTFPIHFTREFHGKLFVDREIAFVHVYTKPVRIEELTLQAEELESVAWFELDELYNRCRKNDPQICVPLAGLDVLRQYLFTSQARE